jgi:23S rRNA pseudouridine2605 synthase
MGAGRKSGVPRVPLSRALSKLGILSRTRAAAAILAGRVKVGGRVVRDPAQLVAVDRDRFVVDEEPRQRAAWRTILLHKPRGVVTTRHDPEGRRTVYDVLAGVEPDALGALNAIGRLDLATTGLLLLTTDTQLANWITDPGHGVPRVYLVTVRGDVSDEELARLRDGVESRGERLRAHAVTCRKRSQRESHLTVELTEGRNREVRRLFEAVGHEVTRLKRVRLGLLELGSLDAGCWRDVSRDEIRAAFPLASIDGVRRIRPRLRSVP